MFSFTIVFYVSVRHSFRSPCPAVRWMACFLGFIQWLSWDYLLPHSANSFLYGHPWFLNLISPFWCSASFLWGALILQLYGIGAWEIFWGSVNPKCLHFTMAMDSLAECKTHGLKSLFLQNFEVIMPPVFELLMLLPRILIPCWFLWLGFKYLLYFLFSLWKLLASSLYVWCFEVLLRYVWVWVLFIIVDS